MLSGSRTHVLNYLKDPQNSIQFKKNIKVISEFYPSVIQGVSNAAIIKKETANIIKELNKLEKIQAEFGKNTAEKRRGFFNISFSLFSDKKVHPAKYDKSVTVTSQITRAEKNCMNIGGTQCVLTGDAESTTDPVSGSGFRTTILRAALLQSSLGNPSFADQSLTQGVFEWSSNLSAQSMREEGLAARLHYRKGTEKLERYLDIAETGGILENEDKQWLSMMNAKVKLKRKGHTVTFQDSEKEEIENKVAKIQKQLKEKYTFVKGRSPLKMPHRVTEAQKKLFEKTLKKILKKDFLFTLSPKDIDILWQVCAEIALIRPTGKFSASGQNYVDEAWFMPLWLTTKEISNLL